MTVMNLKIESISTRKLFKISKFIKHVSIKIKVLKLHFGGLKNKKLIQKLHIYSCHSKVELTTDHYFILTKG